MRINANDDLDVIGLCMNGCDDMNITYAFSLFYSSLVNETNQWFSFNNTRYFLTTDVSSQEFVISKNLFVDYPYVIWKIQLSAYSQSYNEFIEGPSINFYVNYPPKNGSCDINPKNGTTSTNFTFTCNNWSDSDGGLEDYVFFGKFTAKKIHKS